MIHGVDLHYDFMLPVTEAEIGEMRVYVNLSFKIKEYMHAIMHTAAAAAI